MFAGSRADLWPLVPVLEALAAADDLEPVLLAGGTLTEAELAEVTARDPLGGLAVATVGGRPASGDAADLVAAAGQGAAGVAAWLAGGAGSATGGPRSPAAHLLCVLGDRYETLAAAWAATVVGVPIVHLHGGEVTLGSTDDALRHAITKLAHLHCCATAGYATRVRSLGEEDWRVHVTGAPGLDRLRADAAATSLEAVAAGLGVPLRRPVALCTYHPPTACATRSLPDLEALLSALGEVPTVIVTAPGADPGAAEIERRLRAWCAARPGAVFVPALGARYASVLGGVDVVVGNSSSGIVEAPTLGVPTVNVGDRQKGRVRAASVLDVPGDPARIRRALQEALSPSFRDRARRVTNPYGDGRAAERIVEVMRAAPLGRLIPKGFVDPPPGPAAAAGMAASGRER